MPKVSERQTLLTDVESMLEMLILNGQEDSKDFSDFMDLKIALSASRFLNLRKHLAKNRNMNEMFLRYGPRDFKQAARHGALNPHMLVLFSTLHQQQPFQHPSVPHQ